MKGSPYSDLLYLLRNVLDIGVWTAEQTETEEPQIQKHWIHIMNELVTALKYNYFSNQCENDLNSNGHKTPLVRSLK